MDVLCSSCEKGGRFMKVSGWLLYNEERANINQGFIQWMLEEAFELGIELTVLMKEDLTYGVFENKLFFTYKGAELDQAQFCIMRNNDPLLSKQIEMMGIPVFNSGAVSDLSNHKGKTHQFLAGRGIPMLDTIFVKKSEFRVGALPFSYPLVVKDAFGMSGVGVEKIDSREELAAYLNATNATDLIIQKMGDVPGKDVRVFVVGKKIIAAILRYSDCDFRANFSLGGNARLYELTSEQRALVEIVIDQFGDLGFVGIDFLFDQEGNFIFNEIEDVAGSRTLYANSDVNIVKIYLEHVLSSIAKSV